MIAASQSAWNLAHAIRDAVHPTLRELSTLQDARHADSAAVQTIFPSINRPPAGFEIVRQSNLPMFYFLPRSQFEVRTNAWLNGSQRDQMWWGPIGSGKSYMLARMSTSLLHMFFRQNEAPQYLIYIPSCWHMMNAPALYLQRTLMVAYGLNEDRLRQIAELPDSWDATAAWIKKRVDSGDRLYIIADQFSALREADTLANTADRERCIDLNMRLDALCDLIESSNGFVIKASSSNNNELDHIDPRNVNGVTLFDRLSQVPTIFVAIPHTSSSAVPVTHVVW